MSGVAHRTAAITVTDSGDRVDGSGRSGTERAAAAAAHTVLVHDIVRDCAGQGVSVAPVLAEEALRLLSLNPDHARHVPCAPRVPQRAPAAQPQAAQSRSPQNQNLRTACIRWLLDRSCPGLAATRLRVAFRRKYRDPGATARERAALVDSRLAPLLAEVLGDETASAPWAGLGAGVGAGAGAGLVPAVGSSRAQHERLYRSMVASAVLRSGLGNPADESVMKEATAAMQSVYPAREVPHFLQLSADERREQLVELSDITAGIRIFNWSCRKIGHNLDDLPSLILQAAAATSALLQDSLRTVEPRLWALTAALEVAVLEQSSIRRISQDDLDLLKETVVFLRQQQKFFRKLHADVVGAREEALRLLNQIETGLGEVRGTVHNRTAIPTNQVYPHFVCLARAWQALETQGVVLGKAANLHRRLTAYVQDARTVDDLIVADLLRGRHAPTDCERQEAAPPKGHLPVLPLSGQSARCRVILPAKDVNLERTQLDVFCPFFLAVSAGGLLPGCPGLGLYEVEGKLYALSSPEAARNFAADPHKYLIQALSAVRSRPALIGFLELQGKLQPFRDSLSMGDAVPLPADISDAGVQTELSNRERLSPRSQTAPHRARSASTQTSCSAYRKTTSAQTPTLKEAGVQCPRHAATGTRTHQRTVPEHVHAAIGELLPERVAAASVATDPAVAQLAASEEYQLIPATSFLELSAESRSSSCSRGGSSPYTLTPLSFGNRMTMPANDSMETNDRPGSAEMNEQRTPDGSPSSDERRMPGHEERPVGPVAGSAERWRGQTSTSAEELSGSAPRSSVSPSPPSSASDAQSPPPSGAVKPIPSAIPTGSAASSSSSSLH